MDACLDPIFETQGITIRRDGFDQQFISVVVDDPLNISEMWSRTPMEVSWLFDVNSTRYQVLDVTKFRDGIWKHHVRRFYGTI